MNEFIDGHDVHKAMKKERKMKIKKPNPFRYRKDRVTLRDFVMYVRNARPPAEQLSIPEQLSLYVLPFKWEGLADQPAIRLSTSLVLDPELDVTDLYVAEQAAKRILGPAFQPNRDFWVRWLCFDLVTGAVIGELREDSRVTKPQE